MPRWRQGHPVIARWSPSRLMATLLAAISLLVVACGGGGVQTATTVPARSETAAPTTAGPVASPSLQAQTAPTAAPSPTPSASSDPSPAARATTPPAATALPSPGPGQFANPVYDSDFPDPFVLKAGGTYYAYATNSDIGNVPTLESKDLVEWTIAGDAMPQLAPWVSAGNTWAPEVLRRKDGKFVVYYTAESTNDFLQCIGHAVSNSPRGPFVDNATQPFICQAEEGGSIDANPFVDSDGSQYLFWKNDGNRIGIDTYIYAQKLSPDGLNLVGKPMRLVQQDEDWEGTLVEAPTMWKHGRGYYLFYSANFYASEFYATGYASCEAPLGPCTDAPENPILASRCGAAGPGHQSIVRDDEGDEWIVYHAWPVEFIGYDSGGPGRLMWIDQLDWKNNKPVVRGPTCAPQPVP